MVLVGFGGFLEQYGSIRIQVNPDNGHFYSYVWDQVPLDSNRPDHGTT